jgi:hypothetical protein
MFMDEKGEVVDELSDSKWLGDSALLCDINHHLNDLSTELQVQEKPISDMILAFEMKLKLFRKEF